MNFIYDASVFYNIVKIFTAIDYLQCDELEPTPFNS